MDRKLRPLFFLGLWCLLAGMAGRGAFGLGRGELKPEIRLKLYDEAIGHYERAEALYKSGKGREALKEIQRATRVVSAFPEAYDLAERIHLELGNSKEAQKAESLFRHHGGPQGASLYKLREKIAREVELRKKLAPPPDIPVIPSLIFSLILAGFFFFGLIQEYRRLTRGPTDSHERALFLEKFPAEEEPAAIPTWVFKSCALLLPAPLLFSLLILLGLRNFSDLIPVFLFGWILTDLALYLIFFADLSDLRGFRRPGRMF